MFTTVSWFSLDIFKFRCRPVCFRQLFDVSCVSCAEEHNLQFSPARPCVQIKTISPTLPNHIDMTSPRPGLLYVWGRNSDGQCSVGPSSSAPGPPKTVALPHAVVSLGCNVVSVACGTGQQVRRHLSMLCRCDDVLWCIGSLRYRRVIANAGRAC